MSNAAPATSMHSSAPVVDAALEAIIGNPAAPKAVPARVYPPRSVPGSVGTLASVLALYGLVRNGIQYAEQQRARYGDIQRSMFAAEPIVYVWDADAVHGILRNEGNAWSTAMGWDVLLFDRLDPLGGNIGALLALDFDAHRAARKLVQPAFTASAIKGYIALASGTLDRAIERWIAAGQVGFKAELRSLLAQVASDILTGVKEPARVVVLERALSDFWRGPQALIKDPRLSLAFRRAQRGYGTLRRIFTELVPARRAQPGADLFSQMCRFEDGEYSDDALVRIFLTVMFGAFDTTSLAITSMAYLLAKHPAWQDRLREEALQVSPEALDWPGLQKLQQLDWAWKETLRLMPVTGSVPRRALRDVEVLGHRLPAGTFVGPVSGGLGRHPGWWSHPQQFDPERFSPERAEDKRHPAIFLPFGAGAHACIGMQLANIEAKLVWHKLLTRCRFELAPDYEARHTFTPLGCVSGKVRLRLTRLR